MYIESLGNMFFRSKPDPREMTAAARRIAIENAVAMLCCDLQGTIVFASPQYCALMGHPLEAVKNARLEPIMLSDPLAKFDQPTFEHGLMSGQTQRLTIRRHHANGTPRFLDVTFIPVATEGGSVTEIVQIVSDVTEKTNAIKRMEATLEAINRSSAVIEFDPDETIIAANQTFLDATGYDLAEVIGKHHRIFMPPGEAEKPAYKTFWSDLRDGHFKSEEFLRVGKDGRDIWLRASYNPIFCVDGTLRGVIKVAQDVTADKRVALDLAGQIEALQRSQAIIEFDMSGNVLTANSNFLSVLGYSLAEIVGKHHAIFMRPDDRDSPAYRAFWKDLRNGVPQVAEFCRIAKSGREVWIQASYNAILDADGRPYKIVKFATDITARKTAINDFQTAIAALSAGKLDHRLDSAMPPDLASLKENYNQAIQRIADLVASILESVQTIHGETDTLAKSSTELGHRTERQAASLVETMAAINELAASVESSTNGAQDAKRAVALAQERSNEGRNVVGQTIAAINEIARSSEHISRITSVIDQISFQTNLLALNAGVEAARAGESGRGFAVVASEVRALAQRSSDAAREIAALIETSGRQVKQGVELVNESGQALGEIDTLIAEVDARVQSIATSAIDQATGIGGILSAIRQLERVTQQNAAMFEETSATVSSLRGQVQELATDSKVFKVRSTDEAVKPNRRYAT